MVSCFALTKFLNGFNHVIELGIAHAGIEADPERIVHNRVRVGERPGNPVVAAFYQRIETRVFGNVSGEEVARLDVRCF